MTEDEIREALAEALLARPETPFIVDALLPVVRRIAAEELRAAADALDDQARACDDEYDERGFSAYTWAAEVVRARAAVLDPTTVR